jgi:hypothetical protein
MQSNPLAEQVQAEMAAQKAKDAYRYPFHVVCVYSEVESYDFPIVHEVRNYCAENHLTFMARPYNADTYADDMPVNRLPAFHVSYKGCVQSTHYYDQDPVHKLNILRWAYDDEQRAKERTRLRRQQHWDAFKESVTGMFSLDRFRPKPALDPTANLTRDRFNNTEGKLSEDPSRPRQTQLRGSQPA